MRRALALAVLLPLAGCLQGAPATPPGATPPTSAAGSGECPRVTFNVPRELPLYNRAELRANVTACDAPVRLRSDERCVHEMNLRLELVDGDERLPLWYGPAYARGPQDEASCGDSPPPGRDLAPNETWTRLFAWDGTRQEGSCRPGCDTREARPYPPGNYTIAATLTLPDGTQRRAETRVALAPAVLPPMPPEGDVRILLDGTYRAGEQVAVRIQNVGQVAYGYNPWYEACAWSYYDDAARPFAIPPGTHCDLAGSVAIAPGETRAIFNWSMDECVVDLWGCAERAPLAPGTYHVRAAFYPVVGETPPGFSTVDVDRSRRVEAGATFRVA